MAEEGAVTDREFAANRIIVQERAVIDAARKYYRTGGQTHDDLMNAVLVLERARAREATMTACFCGTGHEHRRGEGYYCRKKAVDGNG